MARACLLVSLVFNAFAILALGHFLEPKQSSMLSVQAIGEIIPDDSCSSVVQRLGYPLAIEELGARRTDPAKETRPWPEAYAWIYATPGLWGSLRATIAVRDCSVVDVSVKWRGRFVLWRSSSASFMDSEHLRQAVGR